MAIYAEPIVDITQQDKPEPRAIAVSSPKVMTRFGVPLATLDEAWRMATAIARSDLAPKDFRNKPDNCLIAMQMGAEIGLPPMAAIQNIAVINGRPSVWGDGFLGVIVSHPDYEDHKEWFEGEGDQRTAVCRFKRKGKDWKEGRFSIADAKKAGLWGKSGPWTNYPDRMQQMRARGFAGRDSFPDALRGIGLAEESLDLASTQSAVVLDAEDPLRELKEEIAHLLLHEIKTRADGSPWTEARVLVQVAGKSAEQLTAMRDGLREELAAKQPQEPEKPATYNKIDSIPELMEVEALQRQWTELRIELQGYDPESANQWPIPGGPIDQIRQALMMFRELVDRKCREHAPPVDQPTGAELFPSEPPRKGRK